VSVRVGLTPPEVSPPVLSPASRSSTKLGVMISDYPLDDNVPGENGRNPTWCFTKLD
jgi:hypothetical protein